MFQLSHDDYRKRVGVHTDTACAYFRRAEVNFVLGNMLKARTDLDIAEDYLVRAKEGLYAMSHQPKAGPVGGKL